MQKTSWGMKQENEDEEENMKMQICTHFSSFVFDMMSSFQLTKISPISPSVRQPESAIRFWKTCSQKSERWAARQRREQPSLLVSLAVILLFLNAQCPTSPKLQAIPYWHLWQLLLVFPSVWSHSDTGISICKAGTSTRTCRQKSIPLIVESIATQIPLRHHSILIPRALAVKPMCKTTASSRASQCSTSG